MLTANQNLPNIAKKLNLPALYFKREDKHPLFSHKGRSMPLMIDYYIEKGINKFVISSSGNAGLACALHIKKLNRKQNDKIILKIFVGQNVNSDKKNEIKKLTDQNISIEKVEKPRQKMFELGKGGYQILRQSNDDLALIGYKKIADEILKIPNLKNVFFPVSSGTLIQGVAQNLPKDIKIFAVQTEKCHPIAKEFDKNFKENDSLASAIIDNIGLRKQEIVKLIKERNGSGFVVNNTLIKKAIEICEKETDEIFSPNGILAFAGLLKALDTGFKFNGSVVCIIGGK